MKGKIIATVLIAYAFAHVTSSYAEENVTESVTEESSTATSASVPKGRSISMGENEVEGKSDRRNPKFGFTVPFPNIPGMGGGDGSTTPGPAQDGQIFGGAGGDFGSASIGTTAVLIKGGILSGLMALKAAILPPIFLGALILFLIAGAAFFTCSIVNCGRFIGDIAIGGSNAAPGFGGFPPLNPFNRNGINGIDEYEQQRPVFQALDDSYKKFN